MAKIRNIAKNYKWHNFLTVKLFCSKDLKNVIKSLFIVFIVCWGAVMILFQSLFSHRKNEKYAFFSFLAIFEFHLIYRLKKGQRPDQNLNYFTSYNRPINFTSDGEKLIAVCYSQQKL